MSYVFAALSELTVITAPIIAKIEAGTLSQPGPWRPPEWSQPALTALTVPAQSTSDQTTVYVFDAVFRIEHSRQLRATTHPIQASASAPVASVADHAFLVPARIVFEIGMSDAMESFYESNWKQGGTKSISAWQTLRDLQASRTLVTLTTRLDSYANMLIESVQASDTKDTRHGLKAVVTFTEIFLASATSASSQLYTGDAADAVLSDRPQTTAATPSGIVQTQPVPSALTQQNNINGLAAQQLKLAAAPRIPGAGLWSSVSVSRLKGLLG